MAKKLLIVEDSVDLVRLWERLFMASGYETTTCFDCQTALQKLKSSGPYDAVISDYFLPDFNGLVLFDYLRQNSPDTPFLLVTGTREAFISEHVTSSGRSCVLNKPVQFKVLQAKVAELALDTNLTKAIAN